MTEPVGAKQGFWWRRGAHLLLIGGLALAASQVLGVMPREQQLVFELPEEGLVETLRASWAEPGGEQLGGVVLHFPEGKSGRVRHRIELANGQYDLHVELERMPADRSPERARLKTNWRRRVTLRGGQTPISLVQPNRGANRSEPASPANGLHSGAAPE